MSSLGPRLPLTKGVTADDHSDIFAPYVLATHTQGRRTTPLGDAILHNPPSLPIAIVNKFSLGFNSDHSRSDNGMMDNTHLVELDNIPADGAPSSHKEVPVLTVDPTSAQALLDNTWPAPNDPDFPPDPTSVWFWEFASESCKLLDSTIHSFHQEQTEHDQRMEAILQDLHADHLDPARFVSNQDFASRVHASVTVTVTSVHAALHKNLDEMQCSYDALLSKIGIMMSAGNAVALDHKQRLDKHQACLDKATTAHAVLQLSFNTMASNVIYCLDNVATANASAVLHVTTLTTAITAVDDKLAQVALTTTSVDSQLQDLGASMLAQLSFIDSTLNSLLQHTTQQQQPVVPSPLDTISPEDSCPVNASLPYAARGPDSTADDKPTDSTPAESCPPTRDTRPQPNCWSHVNLASFDSAAGCCSTWWDDTDATPFGSGLVGGPMGSPMDMASPRSPKACHHQALKANVSCFDSAALCDCNYHGGAHGLPALTVPDIQSCGYAAINTDNIVLCFNDIISQHAKVIAGWVNTRTQQSGPSVERIMERAVPTIFPKLEGILTAKLVAFYDNLQKILTVYLLPFMPFDAINLKLGYKGLCPLGLGVHRYVEICNAIMEVLPCLLLPISRVNNIVSTTCVENGNGYALMWGILALSVPGFDPTLDVAAPVWEDFLDILDFGHTHLLYFHLQAKLGLFLDNRKKSCTFLRAVQHTTYVDVVTTLQTHVETFQDFEEGYLPPHLCLMGLAQHIDNNCYSCVRDILSHVCCIQGFGEPSDLFNHPSCLIQGYSPQVYRTDLAGHG
jgi:hypothetical protein